MSEPNDNDKSASNDQPVVITTPGKWPNRWQKGVSGNPSGRAGGYGEVQKYARTYSREAIDVLVKWMRDDNPKAAILAANSLLDRGWGKPAQSVEMKQIDSHVDDDRPVLDTSRLNSEEFTRLRELVLKAKAEKSTP